MFDNLKDSLKSFIEGRNTGARKYSARFALHLSLDEPAQVAILEEKFYGRDTRAHLRQGRPQAEIDENLRRRSIYSLLRLANHGYQNYGKGRDSFGIQVIPQDFNGIIIYSVLEHSNNGEGFVGPGYVEIKRAPYLQERETRAGSLMAPQLI